MADSEFCNYIWAWVMHHMSQDHLMLPPSQGGINLYSVVKQNESLKLSWVVCLLKPDHQFWKVQLVNYFVCPLNRVLRANSTMAGFRHMIKQDHKLHPF